MLLHTEGAAATCPHQPRLGHNLSGVRGLLRALKSALLLAGAMICAQTMAIKQMLRKFPVNSRLKKTARSLRLPLLRDGRAHLRRQGLAPGPNGADTRRRGAEQPTEAPGIAGIYRRHRNRAWRTYAAHFVFSRPPRCTRKGAF